ncbi:hypothetical protein [Paenibacillus polymyxa]|nr:hypothetical protein [Paenibacillus polymyxa]
MRAQNSVHRPHFPRAKQGWNIQMLRDPTEEDFNLPLIFIHLRDLFFGQLHEIGNHSNCPTFKLLKHHHTMTLSGTTLRCSQLASDILNDG